MPSLTIERVQATQAVELAAFFSRQPSSYLTHFHPFSFDEVSLTEILRAANHDGYFCLKWNGAIAGLAMLRGLDAGFAVPSFGVVIGSDFQRRGLGRLALRYCECVCRLEEIAEIFLKVYPDNPSAEALYLAEGFLKTGLCSKTGQIEMRKPIR